MTWSGNKNRDAGRQHNMRAHYNNSSHCSKRSPYLKPFEDRKSLSEFTNKASLTLRLSPTSGSFSDSSLSRSPSPQGCSYAGAKFNDAPLPQCLPKPPSHWMLNLSLVQESNDSMLQAICR